VVVADLLSDVAVCVHASIGCALLYTLAINLSSPSFQPHFMSKNDERGGLDIRHHDSGCAYEWNGCARRLLCIYTSTDRLDKRTHPFRQI